MANKQFKLTYRGLSQDTSKAKHQPEKYFEAEHIRLLSTDTQASGAVSNEKGNELVLTIPELSYIPGDNVITYTQFDEGALDKNLSFESQELYDILNTEPYPILDGQQLIGHAETRTGAILFTSNELIDCVWEINDILNGEYDMDLLYIRELAFSINNPIQAVYNYENEKIEKVYWVDGINQVRFLNLRQSIENGDAEELIDVPQSTINFVGNIHLTNPEITGISYGGTHTAGMIQYAYNLYKINGSQTTLSPLTELIALTNGNGLGGGALNEIVGSIPRLLMEDLDPNYTHIKLYAIKYTSLNQNPSVSIILDQEIGEQNTVTYFDDGRIIEQITLEELLFLGSDPLIPRHITTKDNRFFMA
ncbi:MAG: hypothetical protein KUG81_02685, partial [Gammaproteobacteria bacterium]|nr:hypothetical protein [Gammaproteobacteria bacterium]